MILKIISREEDKTRLQVLDRVTFEDFDGRLDPLVKLLGEEIYKEKVLIDMGINPAEL